MKIKISIMIFLFVFGFSSVSCAENIYSSTAVNQYSQWTWTNTVGDYNYTNIIKKYTIQANFDGKYFLKTHYYGPQQNPQIYVSDPSSFTVVNGQQYSYETTCPSSNFYSVRKPFAYSIAIESFSGDFTEGKVSFVSIETCDGQVYNLDPPIPPDPPDDGGGDTGENTPPAGGNLPPTKNWGTVDDSKPANACGGGRWTSPIRNWVDNIFCPVITFLDLARSRLAAVSLMMGQGLNIGKYFKIFGDLPTSWQLVVSSLLLMVATLGALLIFRSAMRIYYSIKEGVKWW